MEDNLTSTEIITLDAVPQPSPSFALPQPVCWMRGNVSSVPRRDFVRDYQTKKRSFPRHSVKPCHKKSKLFKDAHKTKCGSVSEDTFEEHGVSSQELCKKIKRSIQSRVKENNGSNILKNKSCKDGLLGMNKNDLQQQTVYEMHNHFLTNNKLKRMKRKNLEYLITDLYVEKILYEYQLEQFKGVTTRLLTTFLTTKQKVMQLHNEIKDFQKITHLLKTKQLARKSYLAKPLKVQRTVGFQVTPNTVEFAASMKVHSNSNIRVLTPSAGTQKSLADNSAKTVNVTVPQRNSEGTQLRNHFVSEPHKANVVPQINPTVTTSKVRKPLMGISPLAVQLSPETLPSYIAAEATNTATSSFTDLTDDDEGSINQEVSLQAGGLGAMQNITTTVVSSDPAPLPVELQHKTSKYSKTSPPLPTLRLRQIDDGSTRPRVPLIQYELLT